MLEISKVSVIISRTRFILDCVSISAGQGRVRAIIGPNGAGKSTLLKCVIGLITPEPGFSISYGQTDLGSLKRRELAGLISYLPQTTQPVPSSVYDAVLLGRKPHINWRAGRADHEICLSAMEELNLLPFKDKCVSKISGGEFQKVLIARALVQGTPVLLLDEPINHLDIKNQIEIMEIVAALTRKHNLTTLVVLHDLNLALRYADELLLLNQGRSLFSGPTNELGAELLSEAYQMNIRIEYFKNASHVLF